MVGLRRIAVGGGRVGLRSDVVGFGWIAVGGSWIMLGSAVLDFLMKRPNQFNSVICFLCRFRRSLQYIKIGSLLVCLRRNLSEQVSEFGRNISKFVPILFAFMY